MALNEKKELRARMGYIAKAEIQSRIDAGVLDQYDFVFAKDTKELFLINPELEIVPVKSRFDVYATESDAIYAINHSSDTYAGMMVMIPSEEDGLKPYVVNEDVSHNFYVIPVTAGHSEAIIDYNLAENIPITNINATTEVLLTNYPDGYYSVTGMYRICENDPTHRIAASPIQYIISLDQATDAYYITEIGPYRTTLYTVINGEVITDTYVKLSELGSKVEDIIDETFDAKFDARFDSKFDESFEEKIQVDQATDEDIENLFNG